MDFSFSSLEFFLSLIMASVFCDLPHVLIVPELGGGHVLYSDLDYRDNVKQFSA